MARLEKTEKKQHAEQQAMLDSALELGPKPKDKDLSIMTLAKAANEADLAQIQLLVESHQLCSVCMDDVPEEGTDMCQDCMCRVEEAQKIMEEKGLDGLIDEAKKRKKRKEDDNPVPRIIVP